VAAEAMEAVGMEAEAMEAEAMEAVVDFTGVVEASIVEASMVEVSWWRFPRRSLWQIRLSLWIRQLRLRRWRMLLGSAASNDTLRLASAPGPSM
jgi:hypothetical protein